MPKEVAKNVNACKNIFNLELEARVVSAAMEELGIRDIYELQSPDRLPENISTSSKQQKIEWLNALAAKVVDKYVLKDDKVQAVLDKMKNGAEELERPAGDRYMCRFPSCQKSFRYDGKRRRAHEMTHEGMGSNASITTVMPSNKKDDVFNYQSYFVEVGLLLKNFYDTVSEGDGLRVIRCWKFMLPYLKEDGAGSRKYALEALYLLAQVKSLLTPQAAHRLIWNRFYKSKPGSGGNIPLDLALEHYNRLIKVLIRNLGPNGLNKNAIDRYCKSLPLNKELLENYDSMCSVRRRSGKHFYGA